MKKSSLAILCASLAFSPELSCDEAPQPAAHVSYPALMSHPEVSTFGDLVKKAGLGNFFDGTGPFTVFAPSNDAFSKMNQKYLAELQKPEKRDELAELVNYHVVLGKYPSKNLKTRSLRTVNGKDVSVKVENGEIWVNGAKVVQSDIEGPNGVAFIIDKVLVP